MKFKVLWTTGLMLAAIGFVTPDAAHGAMVISHDYHLAAIDGANVSYIYDEFSSTIFPTSHLVDATDRDFYSRIQVDYAQTSGGETLSFGLTQKRDGGLSDYAYAYGYTKFSVTADTTYDLTGYYSVQDVATGGYLYLFSYLYDSTNFTSLSYDNQYSLYTLNENFVLGGNGGDSYNESFGSLSGNLIAGNQYQWYWLAFYQAYQDSDMGASANGNITLTLGSGATAVPEPASIAMWSLGGLGIMIARRKRQKKNLTI